jgi:ABC-2 type transport system permease protein
MSLDIGKPASSDPDPNPEPEQSSSIGGSTRFVPGQSHDRITIVNGKVQLGQRLKDLWINRDLLMLLVRTELKVKYKGSALGYAWSMLNPALVLSIYYVVFKIIARNHQPNFAIWLFAGLLVWNLFNGSSLGATSVVVGKAGIVKKVAFPRELLALSVVGLNMVLFAIQVVVLILAMVLFGITPAWQFVAILPLGLVALLVFTGALSIFLSAVNVYLRDTQHLTEVLLMAWFWGTSIVYAYGSIFLSGHQKAHPVLKWLQYVYLLNPITPIVLTFQRAIYGVTSYTFLNPGQKVPTVYNVLPTWSVGGYAAMLGAVLVVSVGLFLAALVVFGRLEGNFAEEL